MLHATVLVEEKETLDNEIVDTASDKSVMADILIDDAGVNCVSTSSSWMCCTHPGCG